MFFTAKKLCVRCHTSKPLDSFHRDAKTKDGRRASCAVCSNKAKEKKPLELEVFPGKNHRIKVEPVIDSLIAEESNPFNKVREKYNCFLCLTMNKAGLCTLTIHAGSPTLVFKGSLEEVMKQALQ